MARKTGLLAALCSAAAAVALLSGAPPALGETSAGYVTPHTAWGAPDLQGFWSNTAVTSLTRPRGVEQLVVTEEEATAIVQRNPFQMLLAQDRASEGTDPNDLSQLIEDRNPDRGYNAFWVDPGSQLGTVKGEYRTSWIVEPANGQLPYKAGAGRSRGGGGRVAAGPFDNPEARGLAERCLMSFTGSAGPVMLNGMYNNTYQVVQTPAYVMILVEMNHDVRIIPIVAGPDEVVFGPDAIQKWAGDSVGWYEGDSLVVQTVNPHPLQGALISPQGKVTERFTRWSEGEVFYEFTVEDPALYSQPWRGEMALKTEANLYEYACHEGNYAMPGVLAGARKIEREGGTPSYGPGITAGIAQ